MMSEASARDSMNRMYRFTRHLYDASRKYFLLGRDRLIEQVKAMPGDYICEMGCGTARNLIKLARKYPQAHFSGIDASDEMLKTARKSVEKSGLNIQLQQAYAQSFQPQKPLDKIVFSYALSIIPPWKESLDHALKILKPGGEIHIVDFGGQENMPALFRGFLFWFLKKFHVYHKPEILRYLQRLESDRKGFLTIQKLYRGYAYLAIFKKAQE